MQTSKYLIANERDGQWGLTISTIGYEEIMPGDSYPTKGHADGYYFDLQKGRILNEYQLVYLTEGEGIFESTNQKPTRIKQGDLFLLMPYNTEGFSRTEKNVEKIRALWQSGVDQVHARTGELQAYLQA